VVADSIITSQRFAQGLTYESYLQTLGETRQRFIEHESAFRLSPGDADIFKVVVQRFGPIKVIAIGEDWCPDVHRGLPILEAIAQASGMDLRVFPRDKNLDIMNLYLKQGKFMSIPVFAFFDKDWNPLCHWIERPAAATRYMEELANRLSKENLGEEELRQERRKRSQSMADQWRQETVKELKELLTNLKPATTK
jgi:thiol-disulfide isomerase/thioredoxin